MRDVVRYSEAFKLRLVEDVAGGSIQALRKRSVGTESGEARP
jgi:transposase-like protein